MRDIITDLLSTVLVIISIYLVSNLTNIPVNTILLTVILVNMWSIKKKINP